MNFKLHFKDKDVENRPTERQNLEPIVNFNPLNAELNPIFHLTAVLGAHHIFHVSGLRVKIIYQGKILFFLVLSLSKQDSNLHRAVTHSLLLHFIKFF